MKLRQFSSHDILAVTILVLSTIGLSWSALFCLDKLFQLLGYDRLFHGTSQAAVLTLITTIISIIVRYLPSSVQSEKFNIKLRDVAMATHNNVVGSLTHILKDVTVHLNRIRLELDNETINKKHLMYLIGKTIEETELKQGILQTVTDPAKIDSYYRIKL